MTTLAGRRILIAGGAAGIGRATALLCQQEGAGVAVLDRDSWAVSGEIAAFRADMRSTDAVDHAVAAAAASLGGIDGVVYCAGIDLRTSLAATRDEDWERVIDVNLTGAMRVCRAALRDFRDGGTMVLVSSGAGLRPIPDRTAYSASKAGLIMLAKSMAAELAPRGIRVNAICPGAVETGLFREGLADVADPDAALAAVRDRYAMRKIASPAEMASVILFLTGDASSHVTGIALAADGGRTFH